MCKEHEHTVMYHGYANDVLCFSCAVREAVVGEFIEAEIETGNKFIICSKCGR